MTVPQAVSGGIGDYGFFTAVADRLRAGDVLYEGVWDNKDPFVFYSIAIGRSAGVWGAWLLEVLWLVVISASTWFIARRHIKPELSVIVSWGFVPLVVLGLPYFMGSTHLPGVALVLAAVAAVMADRPVAAGVLLALVIFFKFVMLPLGIVVVGIAIWRYATSTRRVIAGFTASVVFIAVAMLARGELVGFIRTQIDNVLYSQSPIVSAAYTSLYQKIGQHIVILVNPSIFAILAATAGILLLAGYLTFRQDGNWRSQHPLWWITMAAFVVEIGTIAISGKWFHHAEILAVSSVLSIVLLAHVLTASARWNQLGIATAILVVCISLAGLPMPQRYVEAVELMPNRLQTAQKADPLTTVLSDVGPSEVAFVGQGNLVPRSGGLDHLDVVCRHIAQRPFNPTWMFEETAACLPSAELVIVTNDYGPDAAFPDYTRFVETVNRLLAEQYHCEDIPNFRLCRRQA